MTNRFANLVICPGMSEGCEREYARGGVDARVEGVEEDTFLHAFLVGGAERGAMEMR